MDASAILQDMIVLSPAVEGVVVPARSTMDLLVSLG